MTEPIRLTVRAPPPGGLAYEVVVPGPTVRIGRRAGADVRLPDTAVSLDHARLLCEPGGWQVVDDGSTNGTWIGEERLRPGRPHRLADGQVVEVAGFRITVGARAGASATRTETTASLARHVVEQALATIGPDAPEPSVELLASGDGAGPRARLALGLGRGERGYLVGRGAGCDLVLADPDASREHARLRRDFGAVFVSDLGSKNGVILAGRRIEEERRLHDGDELLIGASRLRFRDPAEAYLRDLESVPDRARARTGARAAPAAPGGPAFDLALALLGALAIAAAVATLLTLV